MLGVVLNMASFWCDQYLGQLKGCIFSLFGKISLSSIYHIYPWTLQRVLIFEGFLIFKINHQSINTPWRVLDYHNMFCSFFNGFYIRAWVGCFFEWTTVVFQWICESGCFWNGGYRELLGVVLHGGERCVCFFFVVLWWQIIVFDFCLNMFLLFFLIDFIWIRIFLVGLLGFRSVDRLSSTSNTIESRPFGSTIA